MASSVDFNDVCINMTQPCVLSNFQVGKSGTFIIMSLNNGNGEDPFLPDVHPQPPLHDSTNTNAYLISTVIMFVIGAGGNLLLIISVLTYKKIRNIDNVFIVNLVVADSLALVLLNVFTILGIAYEEEGPMKHMFDSRLCKVVSFFCISSCICSVWSLTLCALHIYMRVCHKGLFRVLYTPQVVTVIIFWLWSLSPMIVLPSMMGWGSHGYDTVLMHCAYDYTASQTFTYFMLNLGAWIPLSINIYCLARVILTQRRQLLLQIDPADIPEIHVAVADQTPSMIASIFLAGSSTPPPSPRPSQQERAYREITGDNREITKSVMSVSFYMLISWITLSVIWTVGERRTSSDATYLFAMLLAHSPCGFNGIIYALTNEDYRAAYLNLFRYCIKCKKPEDIGGQENDDARLPPPAGAVDVPVGK